jgi:glucose/arabinose dehydrogenase
MKKLSCIAVIYVLTSMPFYAFSAENIPLKADAIQIVPGYTIELYAYGLSVPTTAIFDGEDLLVAESGFLNTAKARIIRIKKDGEVEIVASEGLEAPVTGLLMVGNELYISHNGKISVVERGGLRDIVTGLPSSGDHQNNQIVLGNDGKIYIGQGTVTNSAIVGIDNYIFGWLKKHPELHDIPCKDITLIGQNFTTDNPLTEDKNDKAITGAYHPFGEQSFPGEVIKGNSKCGGSIARFNPDGTDFELVAWGLRNPFGLSFDKDNKLWVVYHGADVRGSRSIYNDPDYFVKIEQGAWYGWPDYFAGAPVTESRFVALGQKKPEFLWKDHPPLTEAFLTLPTHAGANGFKFSPDSFGFEGDAFIAFYGTLGPITAGTNLSWPGFSVVRVDMETKKIIPFAHNKVPGPTYVSKEGGFNRPSDVVFGPDNALYVIDWGGGRFSKEGLELDPGTGAIWRIYKDGTSPVRPNGPIEIPQDLNMKKPLEPIIPNIEETYLSILKTSSWILIPILILFALVIYLWKKS